MTRFPSDERYVAGASCGRGRHVWKDRGTYLKCERCGSSRTKSPGRKAAGSGPQHERTQRATWDHLDDLMRRWREAKARDYYTLGLSPTATGDEVRAKYRQLAREWHPDVTQHDKRAAEERFKEINNAYHRIID